MILKRLFVMLSIILILSNCQREQKVEPITLTFTTNRTDKANNTLLDLAKEYSQLNPHVTVNIEAIKNIEEVLPIKAQAGDLGDITILTNKFLPTQYPDLLHPLNELNIKPEDYHFYEFGLGPDNKLYNLVSTINFTGLVYNKKAFQRAGITNLPLTWEEFLNTCSTLKASGIQPMAINYQQKWPLSPFVDILPFILSGNPDIMEQKLNGDLFPENGYMQQIFEQLMQLNNLGYLEENIQLSDWELMKKQHSDGDVAIAFLATWYPPQLVDKGSQLEDIGMFPYPDSKVNFVNSGYFYGISKNTPYPEESLKLFKFLFLEEKYHKAVSIISPKTTGSKEAPYINELLSYNLPIYEDKRNSNPLQQKIIDREIDTELILQEYLVSDNPDDVLEFYNKKWDE